jgi:hypothetical protein
MTARRRIEPTTSLVQQLAVEAKRLREQATLFPHWTIRDAAISKARQTELAAHLNDWLNSPGLRPPK